MAREAFVKKLARRGIMPSKALEFKSSHLQTHTQEEQGVRIIDRDEKRRQKERDMLDEKYLEELLRRNKNKGSAFGHHD